MEIDDDKPSIRCFICGSDIKSDKKYCKKCINKPKCSTCGYGCPIDGLECHKCLSYGQKKYMGGMDTDKYIIKHSKNKKKKFILN